jgi:hypothetical protein
MVYLLNLPKLAENLPKNGSKPGFCWTWFSEGFDKRSKPDL